MESPSRWPTNWRTVIPKKFSYWCRSSKAHNRLLNLGIWQATGNPQGIWHWRPEGFDYRSSTALRKQTLGGHKQTFCTPGPWRKEQWPHKRLSQTCLWVSQGLLRRCGQWWPGAGLRHWLQQSWEPQCAGISCLEGGRHYHQYPYHSLTSNQTTGREHSPTCQQKIGLKIY